MKNLLIILFICFTLSAFGQNKYNAVHFNKLTEVVGTDVVIASVENRGKTLDNESKYLLFINTKTGHSNQVDFPSDAGIQKIEQVKIDSLEINLMLVSARTIDLNNKKGIDWNDPTQLIIISFDGKEKTQLTDDAFFIDTWTVNTTTGTLVITGKYFINNSRKQNEIDKSEIHIYDLKTLKLLNKIEPTL